MKGSLESTYHNLHVNCSDSSVSSSSSITPSSGYSSYDILDQDSDDDLQSCYDSHQTKNRASKEAVSDSRYRQGGKNIQRGERGQLQQIEGVRHQWK